VMFTLMFMGGMLSSQISQFTLTILQNFSKWNG
jgi:type III secretory pathway component EscS